MEATNIIMEVGGKPSHRPRVVVLLRGDDLPGCPMADLEHNGVECVRVSSAYEAAAEVLAAPTAALVIDLRAMAPRHARLIAISREMDVEMLAVGALPVGMTAEDLSGVRLVAGRDLRATLRDSVELRGRFAARTQESSAERGTKTRPRAGTPAVKLTPAKRPAEHDAIRQPEPAQLASETISDSAFEPPGLGDEVSHLPAEQGQAYPALPQADVSRLLTPEELAALLENEQ